MDTLKKGVYVSMQRLSLGIVWRELQVFSKLLYKGWNQHRRDKSFQKLLRVSRDLRKYQSVSLSNFVKRVWKMLPGSGSLSSAVVQRINELSAKLVECAQFTAQLLEFIETTYSDVDVRLCMSLFIPFNLLMLSSLSRIWYCLRYHLQAIAETQTMLTQHIPVHKKAVGAGPILSYLAPEYQHYLSVPDPPIPGDGLGTAVVRIDDVHPSLKCSPTVDALDSQQTQSTVECSATTNSSHTAEDRMESLHCQLELGTPVTEPVVESKETGNAPAVCVPKRRVPNTVVCVVKAGRLWISLKVRCARYLSTLKKSAGFRVRLVGVSSVGRAPWNLGHTALSYRLRLMPMAIAHKCKSASVKVSTRQSTTQELGGDDIDDIFSALV